MRRLYVDQPLEKRQPGEIFSLDGKEAEHLIRVLRVRGGEEFQAFDGKGCSLKVAVQDVKRRGTRLEVLTQPSIQPLPDVSLTIATAAPKGERFRWLIEKATEIGVKTIQPLITERSTVTPRPEKIENLKRVAIAACKQSGIDYVPEIHAPISWIDFLGQLSKDRNETGSPILMADPHGQPLLSLLGQIACPQAMVLAIGPEGGWTKQEWQSAEKADALRFQLTRSILRIETAAIASAAAVQLWSMTSE